MRLALYLLGFLMPWRLRRLWLRLTLGYRLHPTSHIGLSILIPDRLELGEHARIGHFNVCRRIDALVLERHAIVGTLNWIGGRPSDDPVFYGHVSNRKAQLTLCDYAAVTNRHNLDCTGGILMRSHAIIAGIRCQLYTHQIAFPDSILEARPIEIGPYTMIGTGSIVLPGATVPGHCVIGAGAVVTNSLKEPYRLCVGTPARAIREMDPDSPYFTRADGLIT
jgi:acetyltransferase-like isoleucine patch superfamily enzyme